MPLDSSIYSLSHLRLDGRRWNELRRIYGQISTQPSADGSCFFEMGQTKVICTVSGPLEPRQRSGREQSTEARIEVEISVAPFSGVDRKRRSRNDKRIAEMGHAIEGAVEEVVFGSMYPHSTIAITLHVLSQDGGVLAACLNATTLALIDAGVPMKDYISACTTGTTASIAEESDADPILDLNGLEEQELPFLTLASSGTDNKVNVLMLETRVQLSRLESMLSVGLDGCTQMRVILDGIVRAHGRRALASKVG